MQLIAADLTVTKSVHEEMTINIIIINNIKNRSLKTISNNRAI